MVRQFQASTTITDAQRAAMGITVRDVVATHAAGTGQATRPVGVVDTSQRLRHEIRFTDETTPTRRAKPKGIMGCEIWVIFAAIGKPAPTDGAGMQF